MNRICSRTLWRETSHLSNWLIVKLYRSFIIKHWAMLFMNILWQKSAYSMACTCQLTRRCKIDLPVTYSISRKDIFNCAQVINIECSPAHYHYPEHQLCPVAPFNCTYQRRRHRNHGGKWLRKWYGKWKRQYWAFWRRIRVSCSIACVIVYWILWKYCHSKKFNEEYSLLLSRDRKTQHSLQWNHIEYCKAGVVSSCGTRHI